MNQYAPCPNCSQSNAQKVNFTWWGGVLGPKILNHVKCQSCSTKYNGKSGKSNSTNILIYFLVAGVLAFTLAFGAMFLAYFAK